MLEKAIEIVPGVHWVGAVDRERTIFDSFMSLPYGTTYNAYLIKGSNKAALVDTVSREFANTLLKKVSEVVNPEKLDYVVMNHAEPDHAGSLPGALSIARKARLIATKKGLELARVFYDIPEGRGEVVGDGDTLSLGDKTLRFINAPWLHWPETMFTYCVEDKALLSCDFFGAHVAPERLYAEEVGDIVLAEAKRYYAEIMMIFLNPVRQALEKLEGLEIKYIAPSHGPVWRNPERILNAYRGWAIGPLKAKVVIIYVSMYGSTAELEKAVVGAIREEGVEALAFNMLSADVSQVVQELVDSSAILFGSPSFYGGVHPRLASSVELVRTLKPRGKMVATFGSYGWGGGAAKEIRARLQPAGFEIIGSLEIKGPPKMENIQEAISFGKTIATRVRESLARQ